MIFDTLARLGQYRGLNPNLDRLIDDTLARGVEAYAPGRNDINGNLCWMNGNTAELSPSNDVYERHLEHIDLQIPLEAGEIIQVLPVEALNWPASSEETQFTKGPAGTPLDLAPGTFAVFFPGDAHCCGISRDGQQRVRKLVGKARL